MDLSRYHQAAVALPYFRRRSGSTVFGVNREQALWALSYMQCLCNARGSGSVTSSMPLSIDFVLCADLQVVAQYGNGGVPTNQLN